MAKRRKAHRVEAAGGFTLEHDGRARFDIGPLVPLIQQIAEVWYYDDVDEEEEALGELLNPPAKTSEAAHRAAIIQALDGWGFYGESLALARETVEAMGVGAERHAALRKAVELAFRRADERSPFAAVRKKGARKKKVRGPYGLAVAADQWATSAAKAIVRGREALEGPITTIVFYLPQTATTPWAGYVWTGERPADPDCSPAGDWVLELRTTHRRAKRIPTNVDQADPRLEAFCEATGVDPAEASWSPRSMPGRLWALELRRAMTLLHALLLESSVATRKNARVAVYDDDGELFSRIGKRAYATERRRALDAAGEAREVYERLCYEPE